MEGVTSKEDYYTLATYVAKEGQTLDSLAQLFQLKPYYIRVWNKMAQNANLNVGQQVVLYGMQFNDIIEVKQKEADAIEFPPVEEVEQLPARKVDLTIEKALLPNTFEREGYLYYTVKVNENLEKIADQFESVNVRDIMIMNNFRSNQIPQAGKEIRIKKI